MADSRTLELVIRLLSETHGADEVQRALNETKQGFVKEGEGAEEGAKHLEKHTHHAHELHHVMGELNKILPGSGLLLKAVFNPEAAGFLGAAIILQLIAKHMEEVKKQAEEAKKQFDEMAKAGAEAMLAYKDRIDESVKGLKELRDAEDAYTKSFKTDSDSITGELDRQIGKLKEEMAAILKLKEAQGVKTEGPAIEAATTRGEIALSEAAQDQLAAELTAAVAKAQETGVVAQGAALSAADRKGLEDSIHKLSDEAKNSYVALAQLRQKADEQGHALELAKDPITGNIVTADKLTKEMQKTAQEQARAQAAYDGHVKALEDAKTKLAQMTDAASKASKEHEEAEKRVQELSKALNTLGQKVADLHEKLGREEAANIMAKSPIATTVEQGAEALDAMRHGQKLSADQTAALKALTTLLQGIGANNYTMLGLIERSVGNVEDLAARVKAIEGRQAQLQSVGRQNTPNH